MEVIQELFAKTNYAETIHGVSRSDMLGPLKSGSNSRDMVRLKQIVCRSVILQR